MSTQDFKRKLTAVLSADNSRFARSLVSALKNSDYFDVRHELHSEAELDQVLDRGKVQFAIQIPADFSRRLLRGERPALLLAADNKAIDGVVVTGPAQEGLTLAHLFSRERPSQLVLLRHARGYSPRPGVFLWNTAGATKLEPKGLKAFHDAMEGPRLWGTVPRVDAALLTNALRWLAEQVGEV